MATVSGNILAKGSISGSVEKATSTIIKEVEFCNRSEFPTKGYHKYLYIALDENAIYRYDNEQGYVVLSGSGCQINNNSISMDSTWSSSKINTEINNAVDGIECATVEDIHNLF